MKTNPIQTEYTHILSQYGLDPTTLINCHTFTFGTGEVILHQGMKMDYLYLIVSGTGKMCINTPNGKNLIVCYYVSQGILGDIELMLENYTSAATVIAVSDFCCIGIPFLHNAIYLKQNIQFMNHLSLSLSMKLLESCNAHVASALYTSEQRLCSYILMTEQHGIFTDVLTEVSQSIGMSYRHVFRIINKLCKEGILEKTEGKFRILNRNLLEKKALK